MQQTMASNLEQTQPQTWQTVISLELIAYAVLLLLTITFRVANLDSVPMSVQEAPEALAAWRTIAPSMDAFPEEIATDSPAIFWAQKIGFTGLGSNEFAARILTALAGVVLAFTPLLFRTDLGATRTLVFCVLLAFSPVALLAARFSEGMTWALLFAMIGIWSLKTYWQTNSQGYALGGIVALGLMTFYADAGGVVMAIIMLVAAVGARLLTTLDTLDETTRPDPVNDITGRIRQLPLLAGAGLVAVVLVALTTGFMTYPAGLSGVGELLETFVRGFTQRPDDVPGLLLLVVSVFYETLLWVFAAIGIFMLIWRRGFTLFDRFFLVWLAAGLVAAVLYVGAIPAHALWLTLPLIALATFSITDFLENTPHRHYWDDVDEDIDQIDDGAWMEDPRRGKWIMAVAALVLFTILAMHLQSIGRSALGVENGSLTALMTLVNSGGQTALRASVIWSFITLLFLFVGGMLGASMWGNTPTLQGIALGLVGFMLVHNISAAWSTAVFEPYNAAEPWHLEATSPEVPLLRQTLIELAERETMGYLELPITVVLNPSTGLTRDSVVAWLVRDFKKVTFATDMNGARAAKVIIMTQQPVEERPDLGGSYVGQGFNIMSDWQLNSLQGLDVIAWWFQRRVRTVPQPVQSVTLWVRIDVYESVALN